MMNFSPDFLRRVVDTLLPGLPETAQAAALPSASQVGVDQRLAEHLTHHSDKGQIGQALQAIIEQAGGMSNFVAADEATAILQSVALANDSAFQALLSIVSADYYEAAAVLLAFGWPSTPPQPRGYPLPPFDEALLEPVKRKQKLWRSVQEHD